MLGFGLGLCLAALVMMAQEARPPSPRKIERLAREMGMVYPNEVVPFTRDGAAVQENPATE